LADDPRPGPPHGKKLKAGMNRWRLAHNDYRVIYELRRKERLVVVLWVGLRRDAYRQR
jgi:mRNA interferase RelE/StbE